MGGADAEGPSISDACLFTRETALLAIPGLLLAALPVLWGVVAAGAGEMLTLDRLSTGAGFSASFDTDLSSAGLDVFGPVGGGVSVLGELAAGVLEPDGPPSFANLLLRICSIVSLSGASGVDVVAGGGGGCCSFGSILPDVSGVGAECCREKGIECSRIVQSE